MRTFADREERGWTATVEALDGPDYKGRYHLVLRPTDGEGRQVGLRDVRWNSERTARRTLQTMSVAELRRRLHSAVGRSSAPVSG